MKEISFDQRLLARKFSSAEGRGDSNFIASPETGCSKPSDLGGLLEQVNRAVELRGDRADLPKLKIQLEARLEKLIRYRDEAFLDSEKLFAKGKAKEALARVERIDSTVLRPDDTDHVSRLRHIVEEQSKLSTLVAECKEDGVIDPEKVWEMLPKVIGYLKLNANHAAIRQLKADLLARIARDPARHAACASSEVLAELPRSLRLRIFGKPIAPDIIYDVGRGRFKTFEIVPGTLHAISPAAPARADRYHINPFTKEEMQTNYPAKRASVKVKIKRDRGLCKIVVQHKPATRERKGINPFTGEEAVFKAKPARNVVKGSSKREFILEKVQNREEIENAVALNQPNFDSPLEITYRNYAGQRKVFVAATNTIQRYPNGIRVAVAPSAVPIFLKQERIENWDDVEQFV